MLWRAVAVTTLLLLLLVRPPGQTNRSPAPRCDRRLSALARRILHTAWLPVVTQFRPEVQLPASCPLHPWRDQGGPAELAKLHYRVNLWSCSFCGKSFSGESELEDHLDTRHPELHAGHDFSVCLADYCDLLRCELQQGRARRPWPARVESAGQSRLPATAPPRQLAALLERTEQCGVVRGREYRLPRGPGRLPGEEAKPDRWVIALHRPAATTTYREARCEPGRMEELHARCELLITACVSPLGLQLADTELEQLRTRLSRALCWFLTCDRYWSVDNTRKKLNIAAVLFAILVSGATFLSFAHHLVWVWREEPQPLTDTEFTKNIDKTSRRETSYTKLYPSA